MTKKDLEIIKNGGGNIHAESGPGTEVGEETKYAAVVTLYDGAKEVRKICWTEPVYSTAAKAQASAQAIITSVRENGKVEPLPPSVEEAVDEPEEEPEEDEEVD